jgi:hypothetical protein
LFAHPLKLLLAILLFIIPMIPQAIYWKIITGNWFFYSYPGEKFFFDNPKLFDFLFSYRKGWFVYTPMMILAVAGLFYLRKFAKEWMFILPITLIVVLYVLSSWWTWWYGGGYGMRAMIQFYAFLAFPMAALFEHMQQSTPLKWSRNLIVVAFIWYSLLQSYQYKKVYIHWDSMSKDTYWLIFGKKSLTQEELDRYDSTLDPPDYELAKQGIR